MLLLQQLTSHSGFNALLAEHNILDFVLEVMTRVANRNDLNSQRLCDVLCTLSAFAEQPMYRMPFSFAV